MKNRIENTTKTVNENPVAGLMYGMPGGIEASERRGQGQLLASEVLSTDTRGSDAEFIALGFTFGAPVDGDELFRAATLPEGWKREGSDHAMWSYLVDARGIRRASIFYKAAFYDRSAFMSLQNVGRFLASDAIYGDGPITRASLRLDALTADELAAFRAEIVRHRADAAEFPDIYGKYTPRLDQCDARLSETSLTVTP